MEPNFTREETIYRLRVLLVDNNNDLKGEAQRAFWDGERQIIDFINTLDRAKKIRATTNSGGTTIDNKYALKKIGDYLKQMPVIDPPAPKKGNQPKDPFDQLYLPFGIRKAKEWVDANIDCKTNVRKYHEVGKILFESGYKWKIEPTEDECKSFLQHYF